VSALKNPKHERFSQNLAAGLSLADAYVDAGFKPDRGNASRLQQKDSVLQRVQEVLDKREQIETKATEKAIEKLAITKEAVLSELAKIGFADIRKAVSWRGNLTRETDNPDGGDVLVIREITNQQVRLIDSDQIDDDTAAAIAEVRQSPTGGLSIKLHDKRAALVDIGRHLGAFTHKVELTGKDGGPIETLELSDTEAARRIAFTLAKATQPTTH
jgi:phage terminase small subunit